MKRSIVELAKLTDTRLFAEISTGISLIARNARRLNDSANHMFENGHFQGGDIMSSYAAEEAAKVLILLDAIRCPRKPTELARTLKYCYDHVAKGIVSIQVSGRYS